MDEQHLFAAFRYVALNPVRARLVAQSDDWTRSSTRALLAGKDDHVVTVAPALERIGDFRAFLAEEFDEAWSTGRRYEAELDRKLAPGRRGPKQASVVDGLAGASKIHETLLRPDRPGPAR